MYLLAQAAEAAALPSFISFVQEHWRFCVLHFLEFAIWGAWFVVLGNLLNARGFSRKEIARIYATMPIGSMISPLIIGPLADKYLNTEVIIGVSHLIGAALLFAMARAKNARPFFWIALVYALAYSPTLSLGNSIVFAHDKDLFGGHAQELFPWIRVFGTIGWIVAGLSHALILKKGEPVNERPVVLAAVLSLILGCFAFTLPTTKPAAEVAKADKAAKAAAATKAGKAVPEEQEKDEIGIIDGSLDMLKSHPVFFGVTFVAAMAMGLYFAFAALFLEKTGVPANTVGPVMTIGQWIEIFFMFSLPWFLGTDNVNMNRVLLIGICAWAVRFALFAAGRPLPLVLVGIAIHGICFDFFFAAGFINAEVISPKGLTATAQTLYGFLVYGLGMYLGSELSGWLNQHYTTTEDGEEKTRWRPFWLIPCVIVSIAAVVFFVSTMGDKPAPDGPPAKADAPAKTPAAN